MSNISPERLKQYVERIERLEIEKKEAADAIKDVYAEVKSAGFDAPIVKEMVRLRKLDSEKRQERFGLIKTYANALQLELF